LESIATALQNLESVALVCGAGMLLWVSLLVSITPTTAAL
jgi:hypothetical protein